MARTLARSGHYGPSLPPANPPWQHGVSSPAPPGRPTLYGLSVLSSPHPLAARSSGSSCCGGQRRSASRPPRPGRLARPPHVPGRRLLSFSMPDTPSCAPLRRPRGRARPGCSFPDRQSPRPCSTRHRAAAGGPRGPTRGPTRWRPSGAVRASPTSSPGDVLVGDRGFCSFLHLATLAARGAPCGVPGPCPADRRLRSAPAARQPRRRGEQGRGRPPLAALGAAARGQARPGGRVVQAGRRGGGAGVAA